MNKTCTVFYSGILILFVFHTCVAQKAAVNEFYYWVYRFSVTKYELPKTGYSALNAPERLPYLYPAGVQTKQFSSYDVTGGNNDGNFNKAFTRYTDKKGEHVIFDEYGPGALYRQQMNIWINDKFGVYPGAGTARIKYYFDNEPQPRINCTIDELFSSNATPLNQFLNFADTTGLFNAKNARRFTISYSPVIFKKRLKITVIPPTDWSARNTTWYQFTYLSFPPGMITKSWEPHIGNSKPVETQWSQTGNDPKDTAGNTNLNYKRIIKDGDSTVITINKAGAIASLKFMFSPYNPAVFYNTRLKIYWDGSKQSAVDVPLGCFFGGNAHDFLMNAPDVSAKRLQTLFFGFDGLKHTFYSYWPMPFWKKACIVLVNHSGAAINSLSCEIAFKPTGIYTYRKGEAGYFYAKRTHDQNWKTKPYAQAFYETGRGQVTGISFYSNNYDMDGDEFTYIDGSKTPQIHGDGTEDDHNQGWGGGDYQQPLWGSLINGYQGAYRIYFNDSYIFNKSINIRYEQETAGRHADASTQTDVMIWYYKSPFNDTLKLTDRVDIGNLQSERKHNYHIKGQIWEGAITSSYDGYTKDREYYKVHDSGRAFTKSSSFVVHIPAVNGGVRLRRRLDRKNTGQQLAWVYVDGERVEKPWYVATYSDCPDNQRWYDSDFDIPARFTKGKKKICIQIAAAQLNE